MGLQCVNKPARCSSSCSSTNSHQQKLPFTHRAPMSPTMRQVIRFTLQTDKIRYRTNCWDTPCEGPKLANSLVTNTHFWGGGRVSWHLHAVPSHPFALAWFTHWIQQKFILLFIFTAADTTCPCTQDQNTTDIPLEVAFNDTSFSRCATSTRGYFCSSLISSRYNINVLSTILIYFFFFVQSQTRIRCALLLS